VNVLSASFHSMSVGVVEMNRAQLSPPWILQSMFHVGIAADSDFHTREGKAHGGEPLTNLIGPGSVLVHERRYGSEGSDGRATSSRSTSSPEVARKRSPSACGGASGIPQAAS